VVSHLASVGLDLDKMQSPFDQPAHTVLGVSLAYVGNVVFAQPGRCWRMVMQASVMSDRGMASGSPIHCPRKAKWVGKHQVGKQELTWWSCDDHSGGLEKRRMVFV